MEDVSQAHNITVFLKELPNFYLTPVPDRTNGNYSFEPGHPKDLRYSFDASTAPNRFGSFLDIPIPLQHIEKRIFLVNRKSREELVS